MPLSPHMELVLEAAEMRARELLNQASKYEGLASETERIVGSGQQAVADETMNEHYQPLRDAIDRVREEANA